MFTSLTSNFGPPNWVSHCWYVFTLDSPCFHNMSYAIGLKDFAKEYLDRASHHATGEQVCLKLTLQFV
jgi:hypothetical protein